MTCRMILELYYTNFLHIEKELVYHGDDMKEIGEDIDRDTNAIIEYMRTEDDAGEPTFCFSGFCFRKKGLIAASLSEPEF